MQNNVWLKIGIMASEMMDYADYIFPHLHVYDDGQKSENV